MTSTDRLPPTLVATHARAVRALALVLVDDRDDAEDVEQDTWLRALSAPPASLDRLGGWFRTVARGFAAKRRRARGRRLEHERRYAEEREHAAVDDVDRADVLRAVVESLLELDEPYRSTVFLRYFEDLSPTAIAARQNAPLATVESRLARAHAKLRGKLERRLGDGDRATRRALALFAGWTEAARGAASWTTGALIVSTKTKIVVAVAGLLLAWLGWRELRAPAEALSPAAVAAEASNVGAAPLAAPTTPADSARAAHGDSANAVANAQRASNAPLGAGPYEYELDVAPLDALERPQAATNVFLAPEGRPFARLGTTDWDGHLHVQWRAFAPRFDAVIVADRAGMGRSDLRRVTLFAGEKRELVLPLFESSGLTFKAAMIAVADQPGAFEFKLVTSSAFAARDLVVDERRNAIFEDEWITPRSVDVVQVQTMSTAGELLGSLGYVEDVSIGVEISVGRGATTATFVKGTVLDAEGSPALHVRVTVVAEQGAFRADADVDEQGNFLVAAPTGVFEVTVGGLDRPLARKRFDGEPDATIEWSPRLFAERELVGTLRDPSGGALAGWIVVVQGSDDRECHGRAVTDEHGRFRCGHVPIAAVDVLARPAANGANIVVLNDALPSAEDAALELRVDPRPTRLAFQLVDDAGAPIEDAEVRLFSTETGLGVRADLEERGDEEKELVWRSPELAPGGWELEVGAPSRGFKRLGRFELAAGETLDLGRLRWNSSAFAVRTEGAAREVVAGSFEGVSAGVRVRSLPFRSELPLALPLDGDAWSLSLRRAALADDEDASCDRVLGAARVLKFDARAERSLVLPPLER